MVRKSLRWMQNDGEGILLPIILVLTGLILVGGDLIGVLSLDRIQNYWPMAVILAGLTDLIVEPKRAAPSRQEHARQL